MCNDILFMRLTINNFNNKRKLCYTIDCSINTNAT